METREGSEGGVKVSNTSQVPKRLTEKLVYWEQDGRLYKNSAFAEQIRNQIEKDEPVAEWSGAKGEYGHFSYYAHVLRGIDGIIVRAEWIPATGYCWEEEKIYLIEFGEVV